MVTSDLGNLEKSISKSLRFRRLKSLKGAELSHMLLFDTSRKPYLGSPMTLSYLNLNDLESSKSMSLRF